MFDFANSSYTTVIVTVAFSVYFTQLVAPGESADRLWGIGLLLSNALVVLSAPIVGAIADDSGRKKALLLVTYLTCVIGTASLFVVGPGQIVLGLGLFILSNFAYASGENLAGAFLPEIAEPEAMGKISGIAWGLGYLGGLASLLIIRPLIAPGFDLSNLSNLRWIGPVTGLFFLLAAIPTFLFLKERAPRGPRRSLREYGEVGFSRLRTSIGSLRHFSELAKFLVVFFLFSCGLKSVIAFAAIFAERTIGFEADELILLFLVLQISAAAGALGFGLLQDRIGAKRTLHIALVLWIGISIATYLCETKALFWGIGLASGLGIGSLQSASRALVGLLSPVGKAGEFFGFWGLADKLSYGVGAVVFGLVSSGAGNQRLAIVVNGLFFVLGVIGLFWVNEAAGRKAAAEWNDPA